MVHEKYEPVIGLEVHCQLSTESKAFSPDSAAFGGEAKFETNLNALLRFGTGAALEGAASGDPEAVGTGGPGYRIPDEFPGNDFVFVMARENV